MATGDQIGHLLQVDRKMSLIYTGDATEKPLC